MEKLANKPQLIDAIQSSRRQLDRHLFFFEKDLIGEFVASDRFKFSEEELNAAGVVGSKSLYQVLSQVRSVEQAFLNKCHASLEGPGGASATGPISMGSAIGGLMDAAEAQPFASFLQAYRSSYQEILAFLRGLPDEVLFAPQPLPLVNEVLETTCRQYDWAKEQIHRWQETHTGQKLNKALLLQRIDRERRSLEKTLSNLDHAQMTHMGVIGSWSVKDILAHLAAWEQLFLGWYEAGLQGKTPQLPAPGFSWKQIDRINEQIYEQHRLRDLAEILEWFANSYRQIRMVIQDIPEEDLFEPGRYTWQGKLSLIQYVLANTANHYRWANSKIRLWLKQGT